MFPLSLFGTYYLRVYLFSGCAWVWFIARKSFRILKTLQSDLSLSLYIHFLHHGIESRCSSMYICCVYIIGEMKADVCR